MFEALIFGLSASGGVIALMFTIASGIFSLAVSPWWLIGFVLGGLLAGVLLAIAIWISDRL